MELKPFVFAQGDESAAMAAELVLTQIFGDIPYDRVPTSVDARINTGDKCLQTFFTKLKELGAGVKMSTASNDSRIKMAHQDGLLTETSANIVLRPLARAICMFRFIEHPSRYEKPVAVLRYGSGDFYNEVSFEVKKEGDVEYGYATTRINLTDLANMAQIGVRLARQYHLNINVSSKWTIAQSEREFQKRVTAALSAAGVQYGEHLTDDAIAKIAAETAGNWLWIVGNANGDSASDVAERVDDTRSMSSTVYCHNGHVYEELAAGTAPKLVDTDYRGDNFYDPSAVIYAIALAVERANPHLKVWLDQVRSATEAVIRTTLPRDRQTHNVIKRIAEIAPFHQARAA